MKVAVFDGHFEQDTVTVDISLWNRLKLKLSGNAYLYHATKKGWTAQLPFYIVKCNNGHGYFLDYLHGSGNFSCPLCLREHASPTLFRTVDILQTRCGSCQLLHKKKQGDGYECPQNSQLRFEPRDFAIRCARYKPKEAF